MSSYVGYGERCKRTPLKEANFTMHAIGKFNFYEELDIGSASQSFAATQVHHHGTPYVLVVTVGGEIVLADRRNGWREVLSKIGPFKGERLPNKLGQIVRRHHDNPPVDAAATVTIADGDVIVSVTALDGEELYACSLWRFQRARALEMARRRYTLTNRECELLDRILHGESTAEIARLLSIAPATVEWHTKRLLLKTDSQNRTQMATRTIGWLPDPT
jgi:DNA-binding CsgD family transcriptional regulator